MQNSWRVFRAGTRSSRLAVLQTEAALRRLQELLPPFRFELQPLSSPGDRDRTRDLEGSPPDFFTRDLDEAVLNGSIEMAIHSAKDVPPPLDEGVDWVWLPWAEDRRDAWVLARGRTLSELPPAPRIGTSSERRSRFARSRFPGSQLLPIRGNIEERLAQLDGGAFDAILMAGAALIRLGLADRITEWIEPEALPTPDGQGSLCMTFCNGAPRPLAIRKLLVKPVAFVGAGVGSADLCTAAGLDALAHCDVCLYDALLDATLLNHLPRDARAIRVGKRAGTHSTPQPDINRLLCDEVRKGRSVVRLKGGDPTLFARLAEETEALERVGLPYRVIPGVSSLSVSAARTGILPTRRGVSHGCCILSARAAHGAVANVTRTARDGLPCVLFMGLQALPDIVQQLTGDQMSPQTPAAVILDAGTANERVVRAPLDQIVSRTNIHRKADGTPRAALIVVGDIASRRFDLSRGALGGHRILLTCSESLMPRAVHRTQELGGQPVRFPLICLDMDDHAPGIAARASDWDWIVLTSPSAVRYFFDALRAAGGDIRALPGIIVSGAATARELACHGVQADICPTRTYGTQGLLQAVRGRIAATDRVLRLRSDRANGELTCGLRAIAETVDDFILYHNRRVQQTELPPFDAAFFASASAVDSFVQHWGPEPLDGKAVAAIGLPTAEALAAHGIPEPIIPARATVTDAIFDIARRYILKELENTP